MYYNKNAELFEKKMENCDEGDKIILIRTEV